MSLSMFEKPSNVILQIIFRYSAPILVATESLKLRLQNQPLISEKWNYVLQTTRILLAHCTIMTASQSNLCLLIANNIRNLYRLYGIDLSKKDAWEEVVDEEVYYILPDKDGIFWVPINDYGKLIATLQRSKFDEMKTEFVGAKDGQQFNTAKGLLGHIIYMLVATSEIAWKQAMNEYKTFV